MKVKNLLLAFNRGIISVLALNRHDVERLAMSAETITNWMPRVLGSMTLRPGLEYLAQTLKADARLVSFQYNIDETASLEFSDKKMRVMVDDVLVERVSVSTEVTNGGFSSFTGWTDESAGSGTAGVADGQLVLVDAAGNGVAEQLITVSGVDRSKQHALRVVVDIGPVVLRIGSTSDGEEFLKDATLRPGTHSITFTPTANCFLRLSAAKDYTVKVDSAEIEASGVLSLPTVYADSDLDKIRWVQSADVVFVAATGKTQHQIERRDNDSWSVVDYESDGGPYRSLNITDITLAPNALAGDITLTASADYFKSTNVGSLFSIDSGGQTVSETLTLITDETAEIRVTGTENSREFSIDITGTWGGDKVQLQRSATSGSGFTKVKEYGGDQSTTYKDDLDNQILYYKLAKTNVSGGNSQVAQLEFTGGSINGVCRVTGYTSATVVSAIVLKRMGDLSASKDWRESDWSERRGYPSSVELMESRLWWAGSDRIFGSETDKYYSYDDQVEGESGPINRSIGKGPIASVHWMLALGRLMIGTADNSSDIPAKTLTGNNVLNGRSSSFDEPLTPNNFNLKTISPKGVFVDRSGERLYELTYSEENGAALDDYGPADLTQLAPDLMEVGIKRIDVQFKPDMRVHCVLNDGKVAVLVIDTTEKVQAWVIVETDGLVKDVSILPGIKEDKVYYIVKRGSKSYIERWAHERDCRGGTVNIQADSFVRFDQSYSTTVTGLTHLNGDKVVVWADGKDHSTYDADGVHTGPIVSSGSITLASEVKQGVVGLYYEALFKSSKLTDIEGGIAPNEKRSIMGLGISLVNAHHMGLEYGPDFDNLYDLPQVINGEEVADDTVYAQYDDEITPFGGTWSPDSRLCLKARAPRPCTVRMMAMDIETSEKL